MVRVQFELFGVCYKLNSMKYYLIYKITNTVNNKIYIGCHITRNKYDDYMGSGVVIRRAIDKYGVDKFTKEILFECKTKEDMLDMEHSIVDDEFVARLDTYNITRGGGGAFDFINRNGLNNSGTQQSRLRELMSDSEFYDEWKRKKDAGIKFYYEHNPGSWCGRSHKDSTKKLIGANSSLHQKGTGNSRYGTKWIHNIELQCSKSVNQLDVEKYLSEGWLLGRKMKF